MILAAARRFATAAPRAMPAFAAPGSRSFAVKAMKVSSPKPLSMRWDGLMMQCVVAAVVYFVPQDLIFVGGLFASWHAQASTISPCQKQSDAEGAVAAWKAKKGLENVDVYKGSRTWQVSMA
mmetsp:Transcript_81326/g.175742  ORF Transcript_81326/g.175742 Transcript_81326/m.175742 type:complete len:122 (-) Transcript_81326:63-428(-)